MSVAITCVFTLAVLLAPTDQSVAHISFCIGQQLEIFEHICRKTWQKNPQKTVPVRRQKAKQDRN